MTVRSSSAQPPRGATRTAPPARLMVRISRTLNNNRSLRVSALYARGPRLQMSGRPVRAAMHAVLDGAHSRRIRTGLSLQLRVMYRLSFTAVRVAEDGAPDCAHRPCGARNCAQHRIRRARRSGLTCFNNVFRVCSRSGFWVWLPWNLSFRSRRKAPPDCSTKFTTLYTCVLSRRTCIIYRIFFTMRRLRFINPR